MGEVPLLTDKAQNGETGKKFWQKGQLPGFLARHFRETDPEARENRTSRILMTGFMASISMNIALAAAITAMLPLKELTPILVAYGDSLDKIIYMTPYREDQVRLNWLIKAQLRTVIKERYEVLRDVRFMNRRLRGSIYESVYRAHVSEEVYQSQLPNIEGLLDHITRKQLFRREVEVNAIEGVPNQPGSYNVVYTTIDSPFGRSPDNLDESAFSTKKWRAHINIQELPEDRYTPLNPLAIQIISHDNTRLE